MIEVRSSNPIGDFLQCCQFCGKSHQEVKHLIVGPMTSICDECVCLCVVIIVEKGQIRDVQESIALGVDNIAQTPPLKDPAPSTASAVETVSEPTGSDMGIDETTNNDDIECDI